MTMTRSGEKCSLQIGTMGQIENLGISNFKLEDGNSFQIKNDGLEVIELDVGLPGCLKANLWQPVLITDGALK